MSSGPQEVDNLTGERQLPQTYIHTLTHTHTHTHTHTNTLSHPRGSGLDPTCWAVMPLAMACWTDSLVTWATTTSGKRYSISLNRATKAIWSSEPENDRQQLVIHPSAASSAPIRTPSLSFPPSLHQHPSIIFPSIPPSSLAGGSDLLV